MANFKTSKNILQSKTEYSRYFSAFRGVDFSSDHTEVNDSRFAYAVNMYKDYRSGQGDAVETIPGFRRVLDGLDGVIYGIHVGLGKMFIHAGNTLWLVGNVDENNSTSMLDSAVQVFADMSKQKSTSFYFGGALYILDGVKFLKVDSESSVTYVKDEAYVPLTYDAIDPGAMNDSDPDDIGAGREHEQRNILTPKFKMTFVANGEIKEFQLKNEIDMGEYSGAAELAPSGVYFPDKIASHTYIEVYQYGVKIPWAHQNRENDLGNGVIGKTWGPPDGYPNGIVRIKSDGTIILADPPPAPQDNTWNGSEFDYTAEEIADFRAGTAPEDSSINIYKWSHAYPSGYAGIEIVAKKATKSISGIAPANDDAASIIEKCTIATVFDNRIFLSGNPEYPKHIFWSGIVKETGRPDPTYFGILNYDQEGVGDAPVVAMMPVADTLMVLKRDAEGEGSVLFHTASSTGEDVYSRMYPSTQGLYGVGCLGPCINFRDDPIFLSKYGVEAMGQLSVRYERAIEHRSSLIDAKLINCDLRDASIAEWEGYLLVLSKGRIFMADSRQMFTHESGVNQYEWYYLEDIGVYNGQFEEYVYAALPVDITSEEILALTGGVEILEASHVRGYDGTEEDLIGLTANSTEGDVKSLVTSEGKTAYYRELPERDERGNLTGKALKYYVEKSGAMTGGTFDAAVMLKVVGGDIFFATEGGVLCKFNFDKRDKESGIIPNEYYDFDGRRIFSGIATKMDNCGIPHLTKNTVKRSTVIKTRTFKNSSFKVKVRTNKKTFHQVGRIINGRAVLEDTDFSSFTFSTEDKSLFSINEKEKKWVEKQHFIYSDEFRRPFAIHYLAYRYNVAGRYKE